MDSASPSLANLKASNPEEFTFVSFFESSSGGWPNDSPIDRTDHIMAASDGYPTFSFADQQSGTCYKVGTRGTDRDGVGRRSRLRETQLLYKYITYYTSI